MFSEQLDLSIPQIINNLNAINVDGGGDDAKTFLLSRFFFSKLRGAVCKESVGPGGGRWGEDPGLIKALVSIVLLQDDPRILCGALSVLGAIQNSLASKDSSAELVIVDEMRRGIRNLTGLSEDVYNEDFLVAWQKRLSGVEALLSGEDFIFGQPAYRYEPEKIRGTLWVKTVADSVILEVLHEAASRQGVPLMRARQRFVAVRHRVSRP